MQEQMSGGLYNVTYNNQISPSGSYNLSSNTISGKYQIQISLTHQKYVSKWQIKYKLQNEDYWKTTNVNFTLDSSGIYQGTITVDNPGTYNIQVLHGTDVNLGEKSITISE